MKQNPIKNVAFLIITPTKVFVDGNNNLLNNSLLIRTIIIFFRLLAHVWVSQGTT